MKLPIRGEIRAQFPKQFAACEVLEDFSEVHRPDAPPSRDDVGATLLTTYARATKTYRASIVLAGQGFGEQAGMLNRSLFEDMIVGHWLRRTPAAVEKMHRHARLLVDRGRKDAHRLGRPDILEVLPEVPRKELNELKAEFAGKKHWTGKTMDQLFASVKDEWESPVDRRYLEQLYAFEYTTNNMLLHHGGPGLRAGVDATSDSLTFKTGPSDVNVPQALGGAFFCYVNVCSLVMIAPEAASGLNELYAQNLLAFARARSPS